MVFSQRLKGIFLVLLSFILFSALSILWLRDVAFAATPNHTTDFNGVPEGSEELARSSSDTITATDVFGWDITASAAGGYDELIVASERDWDNPANGFIYTATEFGVKKLSSVSFSTNDRTLFDLASFDIAHHSSDNVRFTIEGYRNNTLVGGAQLVTEAYPSWGNGGTSRYTVFVNFSGIDEFRITPDMAVSGLSDARAATITVYEVNDPPVGVNDVLPNGVEDSGPWTIPFSALTVNDDPGPYEAGQLLTVASVGGAVNGTVMLDGTNVIFTPDEDFTGAVSFTYIVRDNGTTDGAADPKNSVAPATVTFTVTEVNDDPTAYDDTLADVLEDSEPFTIDAADLLGNDTAGPSNEDGQQMHIIDITGVVGGTTEILVNGDVEFTLTPNFMGLASFQYTIEDDGTTNGLSDPKTATATASFTVHPAPEAPDVTPVNMPEDTQTGAEMIIQRHADDGAEVNYFLITSIQGGTLYLNDGVTVIGNDEYITVAEGLDGLIFTPDDNANSPSGATFGFSVQASIGNDGTNLSPKAAAAITVTEVNDAPIAGDDVLNELDIDEDSAPITIDGATLIANDSAGPNEAGQTLTVVAVSDVIGGTAEVVDGDVVFTPESNYYGSARFTYTVEDDGTTAAVADPKQASATVEFTINPRVDVPSVTPATTDEDVMSVADLVILKHAQDGAEVTSYIISDIEGGTLYLDDGTTEIAAGTTISVAQGTAGLRFLPGENLNTQAGHTFGFKVRATNLDGSDQSDTVDVVITVNAVNDPPRPVDDMLPAIDEDIEPLRILVADLLANDDAGPYEGTDLTLTEVTSIQGGTVELVVGGNEIRFIPAADFHGNAQFSYQVQDSAGLEATATATIPVNPVADLPEVTGATTSEDTPSTTGLVISRNAADDMEVTHFRITDIQGGSLYQNDGTTPIIAGDYITVGEGGAGLKFTPEDDLYTQDGTTIGFAIQAATSVNGDGISGIRNVSVTVTEVNDMPIAQDDVLTSIRQGSGIRMISLAELLENDKAGPSNEDAQTLVVKEVKNAVGGAVHIDGDNVVFTIDPAFSGTASFDYALTDNGTTNGAPDPKDDEATVTFDVLISTDLLNLTLQFGDSDMTLKPGFTPSVTSYNVSVTSSVYELTLTPTLVNTLATVAVNGEEAVSGADTDAIPLRYGVNPIEVVITAPGSPDKMYVVNVYRYQPVSDSPASSVTEQIRQARVVTGNDPNVITVDITRTISPSGVIDTVVFTEEKANEILERSLKLGATEARIVIDQVPDEPATEILVTIPAGSISKLIEAKVDLVIVTEGVEIALPAASIAGMEHMDELYFRVVPIREESEQHEVKERVQSSPELQVLLQDQNYALLGAPITIETNYSNHLTKLTLPFTGIDLPEKAAELEAYVKGLSVFVEHSDGEKVVEQGTITYDDAGVPVGMQIEIDKFSTFTFVHTTSGIAYNRYIMGFPDGSFRPDASITRAELAAILARNLEGTAPVQHAGIMDLQASHWAYDSIQEVYAAELMLGDPRGMFNPDKTMTRAEMAIIAARWLQLQSGETLPSFSDVSGHWAQSEIAAVETAGIMQGFTDNTFRPSGTLTRAQAVTVLNRMLNRPMAPEGQGNRWKDVDDGHWAAEDIESASTTFVLP